MTIPVAPTGVADLPSVPHGRTAVRLGWRFLPPEVRALVESRLGAPVSTAISQDGGFTPGFASVLTTTARPLPPGLRPRPAAPGRPPRLREGGEQGGPARHRLVLRRGGPQADAP